MPRPTGGGPSDAETAAERVMGTETVKPHAGAALAEPGARERTRTVILASGADSATPARSAVRPAVRPGAVRRLFNH
ncbi:hypothetical protein [Streptomyces sp. SP18CS02]|uniref:hypothetical protein n=1 Tax=Streptomyces sp. SP18CS02 TaxID=3002531 RepID=UPI002E7676A8|nr:hypothetical protein [Streptomyces sp. SP18CS02]MEE1755453.1 hypothetical protein [Streptomyces sp. SP18CS02]